MQHRLPPLCGKEGWQGGGGGVASRLICGAESNVDNKIEVDNNAVRFLLRPLNDVTEGTAREEGREEEKQDKGRDVGDIIEGWGSGRGNWHPRCRLQFICQIFGICPK